MTYAEQIVDYLWSIAPDGATNGQIARHLGIRSQQTVYMLTQDLVRGAQIRADRDGRVWTFRALQQADAELPADPVWPGQVRPAVVFETLARQVLAKHYGAALPPGSIPSVRKEWDFLSADQQFVGDAKYFTRVGGIGLRRPSSRSSPSTSGSWRRQRHPHASLSSATIAMCRRCGSIGTPTSSQASRSSFSPTTVS